jgi:hypothetical protein
MREYDDKAVYIHLRSNGQINDRKERGEGNQRSGARGAMPALLCVSCLGRTTGRHGDLGMAL